MLLAGNWFMDYFICVLQTLREKDFLSVHLHRNFTHFHSYTELVWYRTALVSLQFFDSSKSKALMSYSILEALFAMPWPHCMKISASAFWNILLSNFWLPLSVPFFMSLLNCPNSWSVLLCLHHSVSLCEIILLSPSFCFLSPLLGNPFQEERNDLLLLLYMRT